MLCLAPGEVLQDFARGALVYCANNFKLINPYSHAEVSSKVGDHERLTIRAVANLRNVGEVAIQVSDSIADTWNLVAQDALELL